jgi:ribosome biogenesis GTPase
VGKSSLLNAAQPGLRLRASEVSERKHEGRHTTTQAHLLPLEEGGFVVDTPGIREWGLANLPRAELVRYYPEIAEAGRECRFANCAHIHEPGCAVKIAARHGRVPAVRYENYKKIYESLPM